MTTLAEARTAIRLQPDIDADDIGDTQLDIYIREGFDRTFAAERRWPFFQTTWTLTLAAGEQTIDFSDEANPVAGIVSLRSDLKGTKLMMIPEEFGEDNWQGTDTPATTDPALYSIWGERIRFWPQILADADDARTFTMRGYRKPLWTGVDGDEFDGDSRLHSAIIWYATALVYAQLEDPELEAQYLARWTNVVEDVRREVMLPLHEQVVILNQGIPYRRLGWYTELNTSNV